ncbi:MAG: response regulator, partial [Deltaproteobacteria bacterium]|nr:response regulator [Deltaproteobacteria bacterium]
DEWRRTFDAISDIVTVQDLDHRLLRVNQAAARMFKVSPEAAVGRYCYELFRGLSEPCPDCPVADALVTNMDFQGEIHNRKLNKIFLTTVSPLKGSDGEVRGVVHFAKDITAQKKLEEQLLQSQKMEAIGTLAGGIAHDFNNILTGIIGYTEMAENVIAPEHPGRAYLKQVLKSAERATQLIQQIMAFSRQSSPEKKPLQMQTVLKEVLKLLRASLPSSIVLEEDIADNCGVVVADATQMHQVIMNLATNARQAMAGTENGIIRFSLQPLIIKAEDQALFAGLPVGSYLQMEVSDSGIGIAEKDIKHIFDPYFTTKEKGKGTGLGLAVVHGIVNDHGGTVSVYSEPGRGTTFKIRLLALPEVKAQSIDKPNAEAPRGRERVLAVDDEEAIIIIEQRQLKQLGYQVTAFSSSLEAFEAFQKNPYAFDLVLSDMTMPGMNGVELARKILNIRPEMPIIISSGFSPLISPENARSLGVRGYLKKPFQKMELAEKVRSVLDEKG